ncbi:hypothetical protein BU17DRAFT_70313 [Hysterangium stoloniferum]|nr:hypothetical protein BU17DRAFT_70313 [Hysterangium stoloniferum]
MAPTLGCLTNAFFETSHLLPLRWLRLPLLIATIGLSSVCIAVGAQALDKSTMLEKNFMALAQKTGTYVVFDMNATIIKFPDIKATSIVLTLIASLIALTSIFFSITLGFDWIVHLLRPTPMAYTTGKECSSSPDETAPIQPPIRLPFSTRTLGFQTLILSFLSISALAVLIPSTIFARTGSGHLTIQGESTDFSHDARYWDYGFLRCLAAAPWFTLVFSAPASVVTWIAWKYSPKSLRGRKLKASNGRFGAFDKTGRRWLTSKYT